MSLPAVTIITPCYNENDCVIRFLGRLQDCLMPLPFTFYVVVVNDCSSDDTAKLLKQFRFSAGNLRLRVLHLRFNIGHQAAIYQGLLYARALDSNQFIVMDADGEDAPEVVPLLLRQPEADIIHVVRSKRRERLSFRVCYWLYKAAFRLVTGRRMNFGNFCLISRTVLEQAVYANFSHFPAFLSRHKGMVRYIAANREERLGGKPKMSFKRLCHHAFKSFVEYGEDLLLLFFKSFILLAVALALTVGNVLYQKFISHTAIKGWFSTVIIGLANLAIACFGFFVIGLLLLNLNNHNPNHNTPVFDRHEDADTGTTV